MTVALAILAVGLVIVGTVGTVLPGLPGVPLVLAGLVALAWLDDFVRVGPWTVAALAALTAASYVAELGAAFGAQRVGASRWAILGALAGTPFGLFLGLPGLLIGPFAGATAGEWLARRNVSQAARAGAGAGVGLLLGTIIKLALVLAMIAVTAAAFLLG